MARANPTQLTPQKAGQPKDRKAAEDESEAGSDDEHAANILNSGLLSDKKETPKRAGGFVTSTTSFLKSLASGGRLFSRDIEDTFYPTAVAHNGRGGQAVAGAEEEQEDSQSVSNSLSDENNDHNGVDEEEEVIEEEDTETAPSTASPAGRKRKSTPFQEAQPEHSGEAEDVEESPRKRLRSSNPPKKPPMKRPKSPISTSNGSKPAIQRQTRAQAATASRVAESEAIPPASSSARAKGPQPVAELPPKRGRGRPKGTSSKGSKSVPDRPTKQSERPDIFDVPQEDGPELVDPSHDESPSEEEHVEREYSPNGPASDVPDDDDDQEEESARTLSDVISLNRLEHMLETAKEVGYTRDNGTMQLKGVEHKNHKDPSTPSGKGLLLRIQKLIEAHKSTDVDQREVVRLIEDIFEKCEATFMGELKTDMLEDIYFNLVPKLVEAVKSGVELYKDEDISETEVLPQVINLFDLLRILSEGALAQPKQIQPKAPLGTRYRIRKPTQSILPAVRDFIKTLRTELREIEQERKAAAWNNGAEERERKRMEEDQREWEKRQRKKKEIHRLQRKVMDAKLRNPIYGDYLRAEIEREDARKAEAQAARSSQQGMSYGFSNRSATQDDYFDDGIERVRCIPRHNAPKNAEPAPLSEKEKLLFLEIMASAKTEQQEEVRYEEAAEQLGRSMDEIFAAAKEAQVMFDTQHEMDIFTSSKHAWTYDVWRTNEDERAASRPR